MTGAPHNTDCLWLKEKWELHTSGSDQFTVHYHPLSRYMFCLYIINFIHWEVNNRRIPMPPVFHVLLLLTEWTPNSSLSFQTFIFFSMWTHWFSTLFSNLLNKLNLLLYKNISAQCFSLPHSLSSQVQINVIIICFLLFF